MTSEPWIDKYELARHLGLLDDEGQPMVSGINDKCSSGAWPSRKVLGKLRFAPEDVAAIEDLCKHPGMVAPPPPIPEPRHRRRRSPQPARKSTFGNFVSKGIA